MRPWLQKFDLNELSKIAEEMNETAPEVGSETGIEQEDSPLVVDRKSEISVGTMINNIFINLWDIIKILLRWR